VKLIRLKADGFGPLRGDYPFDPDRVAIVVDRNETGKSSLLSAICAALYGLPADRRMHRVLSPLERWRPWEGETYRVELELESEGVRYVVKRDFARGTVEVWNDVGREVTADFRDGKDEFPVGKRLLGLDIAEFEKCALVRQSELELVVPGDEKARRSATLNARLESAADTRGGDSTAAEALKVLAGALRKHHLPELGFEGTVDVGILRLEAKRELLSSEMRTLEHDLAQAAGPLEELARIGAEELAADQALARLDAERRASSEADVRRQLEANAKREAELLALREEAAALSVSAHLPANAEADLREAVAQHAQEQRNLEGLEARRRGEQAKERGELEASLRTLEPYHAAEPADADRCVTLAADLRRLAEEDARLRVELKAGRDRLVGQGQEPTRAQAITARFERLLESQQHVLRDQTRRVLAFQSELAELEPLRAASSESLRAIDAARGARRMPGWFMVALGIGAAAAGGVVLAIHGELRVWSVLLGAGAATIAIGGVLLAMGERLRGVERDDALRELSDTNRRLNQIRTLRAEGEVDLQELTRSLGYRDSAELMRDWTEYGRLSDANAPAQRAKEQLESLDARRRETSEAVRALLDRLGGGPIDPSHLERVAAAVRHLAAVRQRVEAVGSSWSWMDDERRNIEANAAGFHERAVRILQSAGMTYDPARDWSEHLDELTGRLRGAARHAVLVGDLIPQAEQRLLPAEEAEDLRRQLDALVGDGDAPRSEPEEGVAPRTMFEIDREVRTIHEQLEKLRSRRGDLRLKVDEACRKHAAEHPEKTCARDAIERALDRTKRFRQAIELASETIQGAALDTHRRWADFLNARVPEILTMVGARVEQLRFGEDLDFSVKLWNGQQLARGKAVLQLSAGARDQLHLAVRLAISEYLSKPGNPLPLLIDDVFATSDDDRARAGMRLLIEHFSRHHQIIVVTCHRHRHETLAALDPDLYADGVQWLDARAPSPAR
jgi:DNA repair exonuclease SbcCD ATPase subunit